MVGVIVARFVIDLAVQPLDAAAHGVRVVNVNVVVLAICRLLHERLLYLDACDDEA